MPDLNIKGDIIDNFGKHLPTPIIDYVSIRNDKLEVQVSLFFNFEDITLDNERIDEIIEHFQNDAMLYVTVAYVLGKTYSDALINKENVDIFSELYERSDTAAYLAQDEAKDIIPEYKNFKVAQFIVDGTDKWQQSNQNFYDKDDHKIIQFSQTLEIPVHFSGDLDFDIENINENIFLAPNNGLNDAFEGGLTVFAFSSWVDLDELSRSSFMPEADIFALKEAEVSDDNREFIAQKIDLMPNLAKQLFSDISYEKVFSNGYAYIEPQVYFVDQEEIVYNKTPILAINGKYYKQDGYTLDAISETFQELIDSAKQLGAEDSQIQSILDNTSAMLQAHGEESELLAKLHLILLTFPEKSTATEVGRFYDRYKNRLFNVNEAVISGTPVEEKVMRTSKVRDLREVLATDWSKNTPPKPPVVYAGSPENAHPGGLVSALKIYEEIPQTGDPSTDPNIFVKNGFWFFDYERALRNYSNIAKIFDIDAITNYFGDGVLQSTFKLTTAKMIKHYFHEPTMGDPDNRDLMDIATGREWYQDDDGIPGDYLTDLAKFETSIEYTSIQGHAYSRYTPISQTFTLTDYITTQSPPAFIFSRTEPYISFNGATDEIGYLSYLALRGAEPVDDPDVKDGYRMMVFEFQDVEEDHQEDDLNQVYSFSVECIDTTKSLALAIIEAYTSQVLKNGSLQQYYVYASEECNYNNIDKTFNEFFTEGVMSLYSGMEPHNYPWVYAPVMYNFNLDLISNAFGGDTQKIIDASRAITARINPTNGNLDDLDAFMTNYNKIIDEQYGADNNSAPLRSAVDDLANELILSFGDPDDAHAAGGAAGGYRAQYYPMPYAVPITKEYVAPSPGTDVYAEPVHDWGWKKLAETSLYGTDQWGGGEWWSTGGERELYYLRECMKKVASYVPDTYDEASFTGSGLWQGDTTTYSNGFGIKAWKKAVNGNTTEDHEGTWDYASAWEDIEDWIADNDGEEGEVPSDGDGKTFYVQHNGNINAYPDGSPTYIDTDGDEAYWRTSAKHYDDDCDGASSRKMKVGIDNDNKTVWLKYYEWRCDYEETDSSDPAYHPHGSQDRSI